MQLYLYLSPPQRQFESESGSDYDSLKWDSLKHTSTFGYSDVQVYMGRRIFNFYFLS